jgi:hypothetical protein
MSEPDFDPTVRGTVRQQGPRWQAVVVRPLRQQEPAVGLFDDPLYEGGGDSVILWSGNTYETATAALEVAQRAAKWIAVLEARNNVP